MGWKRELSRIVTPAEAGYSDRFPRELLDSMMAMGDPVVDRATVLLHEDEYRTGEGNLERLRALADDGNDTALAFFEHAARVPDWVDWQLMARGQRLALAHLELYGLSLLHNLFAGATFMRSTQVIAATGRIGGDPSRRIQETGGFIAAVLADDGARPGSPGHATATRVRLLHGSIRHWFTVGFDYETPYTGVPIDQVSLALTLGLFSHQNIRNLLRLGVPLRREDVEGHHLLWRYVGYLLGIDERLLTETPEQEAELWSALVAHQAFPELLGESSVKGMVDFMAGQMERPSALARRETMARALLHHLSGPEILGVDQVLRHVPTEVLHRTVGRTMGGAFRWVPGAENRLVDRGLRLFEKAMALGREHDYGIEIESGDAADRDADRARYEKSLAGVAARYDLASTPAR